MLEMSKCNACLQIVSCLQPGYVVRKIKKTLIQKIDNSKFFKVIPYSEKLFKTPKQVSIRG